MARDGLLYAGLTLLLAWSLLTQIASAMPVGGDNQHLAWVLAWVAHAIASSPGSLLSGNIFFPAKWSLAFSDPNVSSGLLLAPIAYLGGSPAMLVNVLFFASFVLCGVAAGALCREWTGSALGGFAAGAVFAFSPIRFTHCDHVQLLAFWWTPIVLLGVDRFVRGGGPRPLLLALVALVAQAYASIYLAVFAAAATALLLVLRVAEREAGALRRSSIAAVVLAATGVMLCAPLVWAYADVRSTWGAARSLAQNVRYSASPLAYLSASPASLVWGRWLAGFADPTAPWEKYLFPGLAPIVLAGAALRGPRSFSVRLGLLLVAASVVASLGPSLVWHGADTGAPLPYRIAYDWLPPLRALRAPARWSLLASLGLSLAAGAGAARLAPRVAASLIVAAIVEAIVVPFPTSPVPLDPSSTDAYRALAGDRRPLLELPMARTEAERYELEPPRVYASTLHWRPIANGYSGYTPPTYVALADLAASLSPADLVGLLPTWEIRTVVLHLDQLPREQRGGWMRWNVAGWCDGSRRSARCACSSSRRRCRLPRARPRVLASMGHSRPTVGDRSRSSSPPRSRRSCRRRRSAGGERRSSGGRRAARCSDSARRCSARRRCTRTHRRTLRSCRRRRSGELTV